MTAKLYIDQRTDGRIFVDDQQGEYGPYVLWEDHQAEVERLTKARDKAAKAERTRCIRAIDTNKIAKLLLLFFVAVIAMLLGIAIEIVSQGGWTR